MLGPPAASPAIRAAAIRLVSSVESSRSWMVSLSRGQSRPAGRLKCAEHRLGLVEHRDLHEHIRDIGDGGSGATSAKSAGRKRVPTRASRR